MLYFQAVLGIILIVGLAWALSENRRAFPWRTAAVGLTIQFALAALLIKVPGSQIVFEWIGDGVDALVRSTEAGTTLVFGFLGGGALPFEESYPGAAFVFAFRSLPLVIFIGALSAVLYHYRVLPLIVRGFAFVLSKTLNISGAASFSTAANVFIGMVEAPLLVRPYLQNMSRSDLFIVMTGGMATIAGTVFVLFSVILEGIIPDPAGHLLTASIISAPAAVVIALILIPRADDTVDETRVEFAKLYDNGIDALTRGTIDGLRLFAYIVGMLIVFVALVELANIILGAFPDVDGADLTMQRIFGWVLAPVVWVLGIPWSDAIDAGQLLGTKVVLNELVAYIDMSNLPQGALSEKSALIMAYAICGFANFGSAGILIGGLAAIVPERRGELAQLGLKSIMAGTMATCMTGALAGLLFW
ncbi:MAG: nucleoside:proton symporter [Chloroflexi bacterium]|nr:nucleoside:proton symporter [Chloroflexota bacterium]MCY3685785.1 nucleoside:proton symporter [Chloroflexota bacterium]MDE2709228.1 nucleoside:proton symporter [Chloroflexota bacterium]